MSHCKAPRRSYNVYAALWISLHIVVVGWICSNKAKTIQHITTLIAKGTKCDEQSCIGKCMPDKKWWWVKQWLGRFASQPNNKENTNLFSQRRGKNRFQLRGSEKNVLFSSEQFFHNISICYCYRLAFAIQAKNRQIKTVFMLCIRNKVKVIVICIISSSHGLK